MIDDATPTEDTLPVDPSTMGAFTTKSPGGTIGRFVVLEILGQGAMGLVFAAYDPDLDRKVALKVLRPDAFREASSEGVERMLREARAMAKLAHPNVIAIHEVGTITGGVFLAMEFAAGGTLRAWCSAERRPWRAVLDKYLQAGRGLAAAHEAGLVHRDFKPVNVLLAKGGEARVADFGLVGVHATSAAPSDADQDLSLTRTGTLVGTPAYMAPEQHDRADVGPAADQFAYCVSLWEALHGTAPFEGTTVRTLADNVRANCVTAPPPDANIPAWLSAVVRRGLAVAPAERWPSMAALLDELARDPAAVRRRRMRWGAAIAGVAALGGFAGFALAREPSSGPQCADMDRDLAGVWDAARASAVRGAFAKTGDVRAPDTAERVAQALDAYTNAWVSARRAACEATHVHGDQSTELLDLRIACLDRHLVDVDALVDQFVDAPTAKVVDKAVAATLRLAPIDACADTEALRAVVAPPPDPATRARVAEVRAIGASAKTLGEIGQAKAGRARATEAAAAAEQLGYRPLVAEILGRRGRLEQLTGDFAAAEETAKQAIFAAADARDDRLVAQQWGMLVYLISDVQQRPAEALQLLPAAQAAFRRARSDPATAANEQAIIARVLISNGQLVVGHEMLVKALAIKERLHGPESFEVARELTAIGNVLQDLGKQDESIEYLERSLAIWRKTFGPEHPDVIMQEANIANAYEMKSDFAEAHRRHEHVLALFIKTLGPEHPHVASAHVNLGNSLTNVGKLDAAIASYERAIAIQTKVLGPDHANLATALGNLSTAYGKLGRHEEARVAVERAIAILEARGMGKNPLIAYPLASLADTLRAMGRADEAIVHAERSLKIREDAKAGPELLAEIHITLGHALLAAGRDRARGIKLVSDARAFYATLGDNGKASVVEADKLLANYKR